MHRLTTSDRNPSPIVRRFGPVKPPGVLPPGDFRSILRERWKELPPPVKGETITMGYLIKPVRRENTTPIVSVPEDVAAELETLYEYLTANPKECGLIRFEDEKDEAGNITTAAEQKKTFEKVAKSWALTRGAGTLVFRKLPSPGLGDDAFRFTLTAPKAAEDESAAADAEAPAEKPKPGAKK